MHEPHPWFAPQQEVAVGFLQGRARNDGAPACGLLGATADPLFSVGLYFLCWHAWREMRPLTAVLANPAGDATADRRVESSPPAGVGGFLRAVAAVHVAALPLLIPTWAALGAAWWLLSPDHSARDLAVLSLAVYLVVTPSHEALVTFLRSSGCPQPDFGPAGRPAVAWPAPRRNVQTCSRTL